MYYISVQPIPTYRVYRLYDSYRILWIDKHNLAIVGSSGQPSPSGCFTSTGSSGQPVSQTTKLPGCFAYRILRTTNLPIRFAYRILQTTNPPGCFAYGILQTTIPPRYFAYGILQITKLPWMRCFQDPPDYLDALLNNTI